MTSTTHQTGIGAGAGAVTRLLTGLAIVALTLGACSANAASSDGIATLESPATGGSAGPGSSAAASSSPAAGSSTAPGSSAESADPQQAMLQYAQCMRDHGIDIPDPEFKSGPGGGGAQGGGMINVNPKEDPGFQAADKECRHFLAGITQAGGGPELSPEQQQAFLDFAECMRDHGIPMKDPTFQGGGMSIEIGDDDGSGAKIDPQSPAFQNAETECQKILTDAGVKGPGGGPDSKSSTNIQQAPDGGATGPATDSQAQP
jgi:hypothetical protein